MTLPQLLLVVALAPLAGAILAGIFGTKFGGAVLGRTASHSVAILGVLVSFIVSCIVAQQAFETSGPLFNGALYTWTVADGVNFNVGFLIDHLTVTMMLVVTFVSLMVHIYTIGYMADDPGYNRFFSYISLFTFSMLMLVMSNNFLQLFFGWEAVGLVSYLLIGFWYTRPTAIYANLKAFLVNRVGDFGFLLGIGLVLAYFGSLDYAQVFYGNDALLHKLAAMTIPNIPGDPTVLTAVCVCLFIGAMGKSAQVPLHVWLPDSMEGPTPISALIHAATMVTAGIFMVARMSPLFELTDAALSFVLIIGSITALFMGFLGIIQNDIKRVVAYSTLSQLGYMTVALGCSAYSVAIFHLMTHAFFKALLFLGAGSVIMGCHHNQDMRYMGGLRKYMPITWITSLIGSLALIGTPFFSGFFSKDSIIDATGASHLPGAGFAHFAVLAGVFVTAFYSFRMYFLVFHGPERYDQAPPDEHHAAAAHDDHADHGDHATHAEPDAHHDHGHGGKPHESPFVVTGPLIALAFFSIFSGYVIDKMLYGGFFDGVITVLKEHEAMAELAKEFEESGGALGMAMHAFTHAPFWLALAGVVAAYVFYMVKTEWPAAWQKALSPVYTLLDNKYFFDRFNEIFFAGGARLLGTGLWKGGDVGIIDTLIINGSAKLVGWFARLTGWFQTGALYQYAVVMMIAVFFSLSLIFRHVVAK